MSDEIKNPELGGEAKADKKPFSVNISDEDFAAESIPAPESENADAKPHKVVRYVEPAKAEEPQKSEKKKKNGFMGEFLAGAAAGAKAVSENISAGAKAVADKKPAAKPAEEAPAPAAEKAPAPKKQEKAPKENAPKAEKPVKTAEDETQFPKAEKAKKAAPAGGFMAKLNALPTGAVIGGAIALVVVLVALILILTTSCSPEGNNPSEENPSQSGSSGEVIVDPNNPEEEIPVGDQPIEVPSRKDQFVEAYNTNNDVMGWLYIPGLEDIDAGFCFSYNKNYPYDKRDITGKKVNNTYWIDGAYYSHYRNEKGTIAAELSTNTVIFGHSDLGVTNLAYSNDDPTGPLFSQLFNFKDPSFAEKTPYIYVTLPNEDTVWEIFAVFYNDAKAMNKTFKPFYKSGAGDLWYIEPAPTEDEFQLMIDSMKSRSLYDYGVEVTTNDKILTLSTCTVAYGLNARSNYRFAVVAKLVTDPATEHIAKNAAITINADAPIPKTYQDEFEKYLAEWKPASASVAAE